MTHRIAIGVGCAMLAWCGFGCQPQEETVFRAHSAESEGTDEGSAVEGSADETSAGVRPEVNGPGFGAGGGTTSKSEEPFVEFTTRAATVFEDSSVVQIELRLSQPLSLPVTVTLLTDEGRMNEHDRCGMQDYAVGPARVVFDPGKQAAEYTVQLVDDSVSETTESLEVSIAAVEGALVGAQRVHQLTVLDDDVVDVVDVIDDFGAKADGVSDDTANLQHALDFAATMPGAVVVFPEGLYLTGALTLSPENNYVGFGAILRLKPDLRDEADVFRLDYSGEQDSRVVLIEGFTFDGNRDRQQPYRDYELKDTSLVRLTGDASRAGRLHVTLSDISTLNGAGDGVNVETNVDLRLCDSSGRDLWRDFVALRGGNSRARINDVQGDADSGTSGMTFTVQRPGHEGTRHVEVELENVRLNSGDLEIELKPGSRFSAHQLHMAAPAFLLDAPGSVVRFTDSTLSVGFGEPRVDRIEAPHDVEFRNSEFHLTELLSTGVDKVAEEADRDLFLLQVYWGSSPSQALKFINCEFSVEATVEDSDRTAVAKTFGDSAGELVIKTSKFGAGFDQVFDSSCAGCRQEP